MNHFIVIILYTFKMGEYDSKHRQIITSLKISSKHNPIHALWGFHCHQFYGFEMLEMFWLHKAFVSTFIKLTVNLIRCKAILSWETNDIIFKYPVNYKKNKQTYANKSSNHKKNDLSPLQFLHRGNSSPNILCIEVHIHPFHFYIYCQEIYLELESYIFMREKHK